MTTKLEHLIKKYRERASGGYEFTPIDELLSDLWYLRPKKRSPGTHSSLNLNNTHGVQNA